MSEYSIECEPFSANRFSQLVERLCGGRWDSNQVPTQVSYLAAYLNAKSVSTKTLVIERPYVDRHFIEEYANYYATCFRPPVPVTTRIHAFASEFTKEQLLDMVCRASSGELESIEAQLQDWYRGFIVIRPLSSAPVGRTLLSTFADEPTRCFAPLQASKAHLLGFELTINSVPFQQQDGAVGACATTAAWSALAAVARATGQRAPTPFSVTSAATRHILTDRQLPANGGLDQQQLLSAIRECGFSPYVLKASRNFELFSHSLKCYLASGIPVVLRVESGKDGHHAVTAVGFRSPDEGESVPDFAMRLSESHALVTSGFKRIYVHEDRLGPFARMEWLPPADGDVPCIRHKRFTELDYEYDSSPMNVYSGIVPLYPKLRLSAADLLDVAGEVQLHVRDWVGPRFRDSIRINMRFMLGGTYFRELLQLGIQDPKIVSSLMSGAALPRYVGVIRFSVNGESFGDVVCDTTDIYRAKPKFACVLAMVPLVSSYVKPFESFANTYLRDHTRAPVP